MYAQQAWEKPSQDGFKNYLNSIGRYDLLTFEQEQSLGTAIQKGMAVTKYSQEYEKKHGKPPSIANLCHHFQATEIELKRIEREASRAKEKLINHNLRLVVAVAKKYTDRGLSLDDLCQEGSLGLQHATEKFDPTKKYRFSTYAYWWIRQAMTRAIAESSRTIRLPIHITEKLNKIKSAVRKFRAEYNRMPSQEELANALEMTLEDLEKFRELKNHTISLNIKIGTEADSELMDLVSEDGDSALDFAVESDMRESVDAILKTHLDPREIEIIALRFGLYGHREMTLNEIGRSLNVSRERIRQIETKAIRKLRHPAVAQKLKGLIDRSSAK